jgi:hypothetical protein
MSKHPRRAHKYLRIRSGPRAANEFKFRCVLPDCHHYVTEEFIVGKMSECWRCSEEFLIDQKAAMLKKPHCSKCTRRRDVADDVREPLPESPI